LPHINIEGTAARSLPEPGGRALNGAPEREPTPPKARERT
jgi:hypothetical protein